MTAIITDGELLADWEQALIADWDGEYPYSADDDEGAWMPRASDDELRQHYGGGYSVVKLRESDGYGDYDYAEADEWQE